MCPHTDVITPTCTRNSTHLLGYITYITHITLHYITFIRYYSRFFAEDRKVGSGGYGGVFVCTHRLDGTFYDTVNQKSKYKSYPCCAFS
jgi:hypothetical protein